MPETFDAIVVGAGIVGAACAAELAREQMRVLVCEAAEFSGGGATAAGMGHIAVMDDSEAQYALTAYSQRLWRELSVELPRAAEYVNCGSLWVAADHEEMAEVHRKHRFYCERGLPVEVLDAQQLAEAEPELRPGLAGALRMSADSVCYPPCATAHLLRNIPVRYRAEVAAVSDRGVRLADDEQIGAALTVVANGTAATRLIPDIEMKPRKGHLAITDRCQGFLRHQLIELGYLKSAHAVAADSVAFNAQPRATGQILIGSSRQYGVEAAAIDWPLLSRMLQRAVMYMPGLETLPVIRTWTGFRAATVDKLPLIGVAPGFRNVYVATGHEGLGISTSLASARLLVDQIAGRESEIAREAYQPDRSFALHA